MSTETYRFSTSGITCGGCANSVITILKRLPGVVAVQVDVAGKTATVQVQPGGPSVEALQDALKPAGYALIPQMRERVKK